MFSNNNSTIPTFLSQEYSSFEVELVVEDVLVLPIQTVVLDWAPVVAEWWFYPCEDAVGYPPHSEDAECPISVTKTVSVERDLENGDIGELVELHPCETAVDQPPALVCIQPSCQ